MSDRGGRDDDFDLRWEEPSRRAGGSRYHREARPADEPLLDVGRDENSPADRPSRESGRGGVRRRGGGDRSRSSGTGSGTGLYGSEIGSNMSRAAVAEIVGTFILVYAGTTVAVLATLGVPVIGTAFDSLAVPLAFGLTLAALVAALGHVSGAHLNPAVTLGLAATNKFPWNYVPTYIVAQLLGAILGAIATWITVGAEARSQAALASPGLAPGVGILQGFFVEALITFILVFVVISVATDDRVADTVAPLAVGFALAAAVFIGGVATGGSANPARALGPIIVAWNNWDSALLYIIAPVVGGVLATFLYDRFISQAEAPQ
ncbi:MAG TPA: aquaporin [Rubrobacter sp.]|nr:aquaporin [Rubrobacter sp.]